jgi:Fe-S cluster biogenesis protein NfuA
MSCCDQELFQKILETVDTYIRPSLNIDGGDIEVVSVDGDTVSVRLNGKCCGCPHAAETLKYGVQRTLNQFVSENLVVVSV